jgi:hypothetical protein
MCSDAPPAPDFTPLADAMKEVGQMSFQLGKENLAFGRQRYQETMPLYQQLVASNVQGQELANQMAREAVKERLRYRALEDSIMSEVDRYSEDQAADRFAGQAGADVQQQLAVQRGVANRNLTRMGINPNSGRFAALNNQYALGGAAATAGAKTNARMNARNTGIGLKMNAANMGRNLPGTALSAIGTASNVGSAAGNLVQQQNAPMYQGYQGAMSGLQGQMSAINSTANMMNTQYQNQLAASQADNGMWGALGQIGGMALGYYTGGFGMKDGGQVEDPRGRAIDMNEDANGGRVRGPGTGTSDSVQAVNTSNGEPIRLSNGEYIMRAEAVRQYGKEFFDDLNEGKVKKPNKSSDGRRRKAIRKA